MIIRNLFLVSTIFCFGCQLIPQAQPARLKGLTLIQDWDFEKGKSIADKFIDDVDIIYFDSLVMVRDWVRNVVLGERSTVDVGDTVHIKQQISIDTSRKNTIDRYFVYTKGKSQGRLYFSDKEQAEATFNVDSLLAVKTLKGAVFYNDNDSLIEEKNSFPGFDLAQKYLPKSKPDASYPDSTYMYFAKELNNIRYSFSPELDSKLKMKLAKVVFVYNATIDEKGKKIDVRKLTFEIKKLAVADPAKVIAIFEQYKKESTK